MWFDYQVMSEQKQLVEFGVHYVKWLEFYLDKLRGEGEWRVNPNKAFTLPQHKHFKTIQMLKNVADENDMTYDDFWKFMFDEILDLHWMDFKGINSCASKDLLQNVVINDFEHYEKRLKYAKGGLFNPKVYMSQVVVAKEYFTYLYDKMKVIAPNEDRLLGLMYDLVDSNKFSLKFLQKHDEELYKKYKDRFGE